MAKVPAHPTRVWLDEFALSTEIMSANQDVSIETPVATAFGDAGPRRVEGNYDHADELNGFFDGTDDGFDEYIFTMLQEGTAHDIAKFFGSAAVGAVGYEGRVVLTRQPRTGGTGGAVLLNISAAGRGGLARVTMLNNSSLSGVAAGTGQNLGVTTSPDELVCVVRVISGTYTTLDIDIQESQNDGAPDAYANITGLTGFDFTGGAAYIRKSITITTEAWKRINVTAFVGTSALAVITIGQIQGT